MVVVMVIVVLAMVVVVVAAVVVVVVTGAVAVVAVIVAAVVVLAMAKMGLTVVGEGLVEGHLVERLGLARPPDALLLLGVALLESVVVIVGLLAMVLLRVLIVVLQ